MASLVLATPGEAAPGEVAAMDTTGSTRIMQWVEEPGEVIILHPEANESADRPTLDRIRRLAAQGDVPLDVAIDEYISESAEDDPNAWANMPDGKVSLPDIEIDDLSAVEIKDLKQFAKSKGSSLEDVLADNRVQSTYSESVSRISRAFPEAFSGARRTGQTVWIGFNGRIPDDALTAANKIAASQVKLVGGLGYTEDELQSATDATHDLLYQSPDVTNAGATYDVERGVVIASVQLKTPVSMESERERIAARIAPSSVQGRPVEVQIVDRLNSGNQDGYMRGGGDIQYYGGLGWCTSNFNLRYDSATGTKRHGTAGHCVSDVGTYHNHGSGSTSIKGVWSHDGGREIWATTRRAA